MIQKAKSQPEYLTVEEFAALTPVSAQTIRRYLKNGQLPYLQPAGRCGTILIPRDALEQLGDSASSSPETSEAEDETNANRAGRKRKWKQR